MRDTSDLLAEDASDFAGAPVEEFLPRRFLRNGHLQTLVGNFLPRRYVLPEPEPHIIQVDAGAAGDDIGDPGLGLESCQPAGASAKAMSAHTARAMCFVIAIGRLIPANA